MKNRFFTHQVQIPTCLAMLLVMSFLVPPCAEARDRKKKEPEIVEEVRQDAASTGLDLQNAVDRLADKIHRSLASDAKLKNIAVMPFTTIDHRRTQLGVYLAEKLYTALFDHADGWTLVDRYHMEAALGEIQIGDTGIIELDTMLQVGEMVSADAIIVGTITDLDAELDVNARLLETSTSKVLSVSGALLTNNETLQRLMESTVQSKGGRTGSGRKNTARKHDEGTAKGERKGKNRCLRLANRSYIRIEAPAGAVLDLTRSFTIEAWFNGSGVLLSRSERLGNGITMRIDVNSAGHVSYKHTYNKDWDDTKAGVSIDFTKDEWNHVAIVYDHQKRKVRIYSDKSDEPVEFGVLGNPISSGNPFNIGAIVFGHYYKETFFTGYLDEIRIWDRALSREEIEERRYHTLDPNTPGLIAYYNFDGAVSGMAFDAGRFGNHGQLKGKAIHFIESGAPVD
jgi:hypothetical protein